MHIYFQKAKMTRRSYYNCQRRYYIDQTHLWYSICIYCVMVSVQLCDYFKIYHNHVWRVYALYLKEDRHYRMVAFRKIVFQLWGVYNKTMIWWTDVFTVSIISLRRRCVFLWYVCVCVGESKLWVATQWTSMKSFIISNNWLHMP